MIRVTLFLNGMMRTTSDRQDSWTPWLETFRNTNSASLLNALPELLAAENSGKEVFYDHFTEEGHDAFAGAFVNWYNKRYPGGTSFTYSSESENN